MQKKPTIRDIAHLAGVSATAVSLALNDHPRIGQATKHRIRQIAEALHYRPNYVARSLVSSKSHTLGLVITTITNPFYPELAKGIEDKAMELGYTIILCSTNYDASHQRRLIDILRSKGVDGIIFSSVEINDPSIRGLVEDSFPFVLVNRRLLEPTIEEKVDYVVLDNFSGGYMAVNHLTSLGHRTVAIVAGPFSTSTAFERTQGARKAFDDGGESIDPRFIVECGFSKQKAYEAAKYLLSLQPPPTAIFAENDYMALGVREAVLDSGLRIPEDMALVGFDDIEASAVRGVEITTVNQKKYEMGSLAVEILVHKIENKGASVRQVVLNPEMIIRKSCGYGTPRAKGPDEPGRTAIDRPAAFLRDPRGSAVI